MSLQHALLTSLLEIPSTGYDLARRFDRSIGYFWRATHQQIYRELGRMADAGWVVAVEDGDSPGRRKKLYHVLPAGMEELVSWVSEPSPAKGDCRALLVKIRADAVIGPVGLDRELERLISEHQASLDAYRVIEQRDFLSKRMTATGRLHHAVLRSGIMLEESWLKWASEVLPLLRAKNRHNGK